MPCPVCGKGQLKVREGTFHSEETNNSKKLHEYEAWEPESIEFIYSCLLECSSEECRDVVACSGVGSVSQYCTFDHNGYPDGVDYCEDFIPKFFMPHLKLFPVPKDTPTDVIGEIEKSFSVIFCDPQSASNHVRTALEHLLTHLKIKCYSANNGKRKFLSLHNRIQLLPTKLKHVQDLFFAIKWLGNAGSHSNNAITMDDVFDSYELMSELLSEMFANKRKQAKHLAKQINKKKGPK